MNPTNPPPSTLPIRAGQPQLHSVQSGYIVSPTGMPLFPGAPNVQTTPKTRTYDPQSQPPETRDPLLLALKRPFNALLGGQIRPSVSMEKLWLNAAMRRAHYYWEGQQYLTLGPSQYGAGLLDYQPIAPPGSPLSPVANYAISQFNDYVLNIFRGDIRKFVAVIGTRAPNVQALTRDPNNQDQTSIKRNADRLAAYLASHWDINSQHRELVHSLALYGNAFSYVRYVADQTKYGSTHQPLYTPIGVPSGEPIYHCLVCGTDTPQSQVQASGQMDSPSIGLPQLPLCPRCGSPLGPESLELPETIPGLQLTELIEYANGACEMDLVNGSMVLFPFWAKSVSSAPWWVYEFEMDKGRLAQIFPELRAKIYQDTYGLPTANGDNTNLSGFQTRRVLQSPMSTYNYAWSRQQYLYNRTWLPPSTLEYLPGDQSGNLRQQLISKFPDGILFHSVNGELMRMESACLAREWAVCKAEPSETIYTQPYFQDYIQGQDTVNDMLNDLVEAAERVNSLIIFDPMVMDPDRIREYAAQPGEFLPARAGQSGDLSKAFFRAPGAELNMALWDIIDKYIEKLREISGITPAIFGGGDSNTAREAELNRNQALMQLNTVWNEIRKFWAQTFENGAGVIARYSRDGRLFQAKGSGQSPQLFKINGIDKLADGGWFYECEESFPMSVGQRRDYFMSLQEQASQNPQIAQDLSLPSNRARMAESIGSPDWEVSGVREREMILRYIGDLSKNPPIILPPPPPQLDMMGMPIGPLQPPSPPQPNAPLPFPWDLFSIPPMNAIYVVEVIREWAVDDSGQELADSDPNGGWANVMAFLSETVAKIPPPPDPNPPKVSYSISSGDIPPDANEQVMEKEGLLPPGSPPFSMDPTLPSNNPPPPPMGPGSPPPSSSSHPQSPVGSKTKLSHGPASRGGAGPSDRPLIHPPPPDNNGGLNSPPPPGGDLSAMPLGAQGQLPPPGLALPPQQ